MNQEITDQSFNQMQKKLYEEALRQLAAGRSLLPVTNQKKPHTRALIATGYQLDSSGKRSEQGKPSWKPLQSQRPTQEEIAVWIKNGAGLAVVTGSISQIVIIDLDFPQGVKKAQDLGLLEFCQVRTPSAGYHLYLEYPGFSVKTIQSHTGHLLEKIRGIDIRADGGYAVIPPTQIVSGRYEILSDPLKTVPLQALRKKVPLEILTLLGLIPELIPEKQHHHSDLFSEQNNSSEELKNHNEISRSSHASSKIISKKKSEPSQAAKKWMKSRAAEQRKFKNNNIKPGEAIKINLSAEEYHEKCRKILWQRALARVGGGQSRNVCGLWLATQLNAHDFSRQEIINILLDFQKEVENDKFPPYTTREALATVDSALRYRKLDRWII